jgi:dihydrofolate reductase
MLSIIAAVSENNVIGINNDLPWRLSEDLKRFSTLTSKKKLVMGGNTYKSILSKHGEPLKNRFSYVLSSEPIDVKFDNVSVYDNWDMLRAKLSTLDEEVFVIGGSMIYKLLLPFCSKLYLTRVHANVEGDTFFPKIRLEDWKLQFSQFCNKDEKNDFDSTFKIYFLREDFVL